MKGGNINSLFMYYKLEVKSQCEREKLLTNPTTHQLFFSIRPREMLGIRENLKHPN